MKSDDNSPTTKYQKTTTTAAATMRADHVATMRLSTMAVHVRQREVPTEWKSVRSNNKNDEVRGR